MITNRSARAYSVIASVEIMEEAAWREYGQAQLPRLLRGAESSRLDVTVPYTATRWLEIPMPADASPVPWRTKLIWRRQLAGPERILARGIERLGLTYPLRKDSHAYLEFVP
jgi:hypothetical protein